MIALGVWGVEGCSATCAEDASQEGCVQQGGGGTAGETDGASTATLGDATATDGAGTADGGGGNGDGDGDGASASASASASTSGCGVETSESASGFGSGGGDGGGGGGGAGSQGMGGMGAMVIEPGSSTDAAGSSSSGSLDDTGANGWGHER